ncbi:PREDICTED: WPP domain-associated protein isoform X2 [Tarenaya hassleriana]|uniref:WPP domain-associated protein isoform X2 n=1 Tax=Tarenaya hassleriana TaxID=28532 RepID=UPI00053C1AC1|nr:PREDICTED: WPP domain-associated protein isoform X2 [Tarenaya hassleriana]
MEDLIKDVEEKFRFSVADSTMMLLVQQAMDRAHEKIKTGPSVLLRLNAISVFYEFAVMQLDSCLSFVQQEADNSVLESNHKEELYDLREIRDRLNRRLLETELAILEKDRAFLEMSENEQKLKQVLECKETELVHLQENLERKRSEELEEFINSSKEVEFSELKNLVDQQVMHIRQKVEPEYGSLDEEEEKTNPRIDNNKIEKMGIDIDVLKGTMDLAFSKMHNAIFLFELRPIEQTWRWSIEKDTEAILIKGFMENCKNDFEEERKKLEREASVVFRDFISDFTVQISSIRREVECFAIQNESTSRSPRSAARTSLDDDSDNNNGNKDEEEEEEEEDAEAEEDGGNYVAKLIKNHESIIRKKSEELVPLKPELITKRQKNNDSSKRVIDDIITRLDTLLLAFSTKLNQNLWDDDDDDKAKILMNTYSERKASGTDNDHEVVVRDSLDDVWLKMHRGTVSDEATAIRTPCEDKEDAETMAMILEDTYLTLFKGLMNGFCTDLQAYGIWNLIAEVLHGNIIDEIINNGEEEIESGKIKFEMREDICRLVLDNASRNCADCLESSLKEDVNGVVFKEMLREWDRVTESRCRDEELRQEIDGILTQEILKQVSEDANNHVSEIHERYESRSERMIEEERSRARGLVQCCRKMTQVSEDFGSKVQEKLRMVTFRLLLFCRLKELEMKTIDCIGSLREKESVYRRAFTLRCENLRKAEAEVDLLGDQVDLLVGMLQKTLWTLQQHPRILQDNPDISEISRKIKKELLGDVSCRG